MSVASRHWVAVARRVLEVAPLLLLLDPLRQVLESRMLFHMMIEFPVLLAAGWSFGTRLRRGVDAIDVHGLLGVTVASAVAAFWMIPAALDASLLSVSVQIAKVLVWWLAGVLLGRSWRRKSAETTVFFLGNLAWMAATVGMLYQSTERRLCANYLFDDQQLTGSALVALGVLLGGLAIACMLRSTAEGSAGFDVGGEPAEHK
jgi:hypothetical protein